jgi:RimJ/RimL family protein N-acetyltransferase
MTDLFVGQLVKLTACDPDADPKIMEVWHRDTEFFRLGYGRIAQAWGVERIKKRLEESAGNPYDVTLAIHTAADDKLIGQIGMWIDQPHGDGFVWILIGEREYWGKGYGTDAMRVFMRYAFEEWNLHRLSLRVFGFNRRAIRSYEKCGFVHEGACRQALNKIGERWDDIWMGILRSEWQALYG